MKDVVVRAFDEIPSASDAGISVMDIARFCSNQMGREIIKSAVMQVVEQLCVDGVAYSTIDEDHYAKI